MSMFYIWLAVVIIMSKSHPFEQLKIMQKKITTLINVIILILVTACSGGSSGTNEGIYPVPKIIKIKLLSFFSLMIDSFHLNQL